MSKYYFRNSDSEFCYSKRGIIEQMQEECLKELTVIETKADHGNGMFFCKEFHEVGEVGENCGKLYCESYKPLNVKNGRCEHYGYCYSVTDKTITIKLK